MAQFDLRRTDTIVALATAPAPAALAVIRASGPQADKVRRQVFQPYRGRQRAFVQTLGTVVDPARDHTAVDEVLCTAFPKGKSYTGEASFEFSLHGSPVVVRQVLRILEEAGCRPAEPGEFTLRAYLTGRLDLSAAEAVCDLVLARGERAARQALLHLQGGLKTHTEALRGAIIDVLAELEARLDFPEDDLGQATTARLDARLATAETALSKLLQSAAFGQRQREGARVVLVGRPNVGKSTLLNTLYGEERALVFDQPGTTRDALEVEISLEGQVMILVDVAGVRALGNIDPVEALGIARVQQELGRASIALFLRDDPEAHREADAAIRAQIPPHVTVLEIETKADQHAAPQLPLAISAQTGLGLVELKALLHQHLFAESSDDVVLTRERHRRWVEDSRDATREARVALAADLPHEVICGELRRAAAGLDTLLGADTNEDVLETIFSRFCIGK